MSISRSVYVARASMPTPRAWAEAIRVAGFPLELDTDFDVETFSGYLPCRFAGADAGFEYFFTPVAELGAHLDEEEDDREDLARLNELRARLGERDVAVAFVTHSQLRDLAAAAAASGVLCAMADGVLHDEEADVMHPAADALAMTRELIREITPEL